jgi:integrase
LTDLLALEKHFFTMETKPDGYVIKFRGGLVPKRSVSCPRERVLEPEELRAIWTAAGTADAGRFGVVLKLCLYSAQRITKILSMQWDHVNLETGEWRIPRLPGEKGVPKILPLPPQAIELIKTQQHLTPYVFYSVRGHGYMWGLSEMKRNFEAELPPGIPHWTHDLRRTARTFLGELDVPPYLSEKILGHSLKGVMAVYDRSISVPQMRAALVKLADYIGTIVDDAVPMMKLAG